MAVFKRAWRLSIQLENEIKTFQELDYKEQSLRIDFSVDTSIRNYSQGDITIYNLSQSDMQYLASLVRVGGGNTYRPNLVKLEVGYNKELAIILSGNICDLSLDLKSSDRKANIKVRGAIKNNLENNSVSLSINGNTNLKDICQKASALQKLRLEFDKNITPTLQKGFSFLGTPNRLLKDLRDSFKDYNFWISEDGETLNVAKEGEATQTTPQALNKDSGLIGIPNPTSKALIVQSMLNTNFKAGRFVKLECETFSNYNGMWYIASCKHRGSNQSNEWLSSLELTKQKVK